MSSRITFVWSYHKTRIRAELSLENDFANGDVSPCEFARIEKRGGVFCVLLWGD